MRSAPGVGPVLWPEIQFAVLDDTPASRASSLSKPLFRCLPTQVDGS